MVSGVAEKQEQKNGSGSTGLIVQPNRMMAANIAEATSYATTMGKFYADTGVAGVKTTAGGTVLALVCAARGLDPFQFAAQYHIIDGKCQLQAHAILARMHNAGVDVEWNDIGDSGTAEAVFTKKGKKPITFRFSLDDAKRAGASFKPDSAWTKTPDAMLRASVTRKAAKIVCPELLFDDVDPVEWPVIEGEFTKVENDPPKRTAAEIAQRQKELAATATVTPALTSTPAATKQADTVIDVASEPAAKPTAAAAAAVEEAPFPNGADLQQMFDRTKATNDLTSLLEKAGVAVSAFLGKLASANPAIKTMDDVPDEVIASTVAKLHDKFGIVAKN